MRRNLLPGSDQLSVLVATIALAYTLARVLALPTRLVETTLLGTPVALLVNGDTVVLLLVAALITSGSDAMLRGHPLWGGTPDALQLPAHWVLPALSAIGVGLLLQQLPVSPAWAVALLLGVLFVTLVLIAEYAQVDPAPAAQRTTRLLLGWLAYAVGLLHFGWLRAAAIGAGPAAAIAFMVAALLAYRLARLGTAGALPAAAGALVTGVIVAECAWALAYWPTAAMAGDALLVIALHVCSGLLREPLPIARSTLGGYAAAGAAALLIALRAG